MTTYVVIGGAFLLGIVLGAFLNKSPGPIIRHVRVEPPEADPARAAGRNASAAAEYNRELVGLSERLAARNIVVTRLVCDWGTFGCWELHAEDGAVDENWPREVVKVFWDGMGYRLTAEVSPRTPGSSANHWTSELDQKIGRDGDEIGAAEEYLIKRLA
jgi:hypothetical protein